MFTPTFIYDGKNAELNTWQQSVKENGCKRITEWISPDQTLALRLTVTDYPGYPVKEFVPELICRGSEPTKIIEKFRTVSAIFPLEKPNSECTVHAVHGAETLSRDFCARSFVLTEHPDENSLEFACREGRSSGNWMPWFGLDISPDHGWEIAVGWTGAWIANVSVDWSSVYFEAGMQDSRFYMKPGEVFRLPGIMIFRRDGMVVMDFQTVIRDFMIRHKSPRDSRGNILKPRMPITGSGGNRPTEFLIREIGYFNKETSPFDTFWVDAGWYGPPHEPDPTTNCGDCWYKYVGDWRVNTVRHPAGLRPVSDAARAHDLDFLLWFEPERAVYGTPVVTEHPEYFRTQDEGEDAQSSRFLIDLGNPDAWNWMFHTVCSQIDEHGVRIYRQDFNMDPLPVWRKYDEADRKGVNEIKHIMGLYAYLDALRERYPDMLLENCASGGRRMDYEMVSRAHSYCRSDYYICRHAADTPQHAYQILMGQNALVNTLAYVPFQSGETNPVTMFNDYEMFSVSGTGTVFTPADWSSFFPEKGAFSQEEEYWLLKRFTQIARIRDILCGSFYLLIPEKTCQRDDVWVAYQGWNPEINAGVAAFFRRKDSVESLRTFALKEIDPEAEYLLEDQEGHQSRISGRDLATLTVQLDEPQSVRVIFYRKKC